jgi:tetratricopeptide (TPR) repeat protein
LDDSIPTLAEALKRQGYDTAAFVASFVLNGKFGLDRGFKIYDDDFAGEEQGVDALHRMRRGEAVVDAALAWLGQKRERPFFCWIHLYDPHAPYLSHDDLFGDEFADRPYDAEIAYVDRQVGRLVEFLKDRDLEGATLVVVVGDHGEGLGEHTEKAHGMTLYNSTLHVPLIVRQPGKIPSGRRVSINVSLVDLAPTILDLLRVTDRRKISGTSLQPVLAGSEFTPSLCYGATDEPFLINGCSPMRSLTEGGWKYVRTTRPELFNLANDPHERQNLAESDPVKMRAMEERIAKFESRLVARAQAQVQLSAAERRTLASLGYAGGMSQLPEGEPPPDLPDIKDVLPFDIAAEQAEKLINEGSADAGIVQLREVIIKAPTHTMAYRLLGTALTEKAEFEEAKAAFCALLAVKPDALAGYYGLGNVFVAEGRPDLAIAEFSKAVELDPEFAEAHFNLGAALVQIGRPDAALGHFGLALEIDPGYAIAYQGRANLLANLGRIDEAISDWKMSLKYAPDEADSHHHLGIVLADRGAATEAREHLVRAVELSPGDADLQYDLGLFLVRQREYSDAIRHLSKALELRPGYQPAQERLNEARRGAKRDQDVPGTLGAGQPASR